MRDFVLNRLAIALISLLSFTAARATADELKTEKFHHRDKLTKPMIRALQDPDSVTLYSLAPVLPKADQTGYFQWTELGKSAADECSKASICRQILTDIRFGGASFCAFQPHHAVTVSRSTLRVDFVICFHCKDVDIYKDGKFWGRAGITVFNQQLESRLNEELAKAGVRQAPGYTPE